MDELREYAYEDILDLMYPEEMLAFIRLYRAAVCVVESDWYDVRHSRMLKLEAAVEDLRQTRERGRQEAADDPCFHVAPSEDAQREQQGNDEANDRGDKKQE
jgi:hypothetical protein